MCPGHAGKHASMLGKCSGRLVGDLLHHVGMAAGWQVDIHNPDATTAQKWFIIKERRQERRREEKNREELRGTHLVGVEGEREKGVEFFLKKRLLHQGAAWP